MDRLLAQEGIAENLRFMVLEVTKQIENTEKVLDKYNEKLIESIESRDDYIDNLKSVIENRCFSAIHKLAGTDKRSVDIMRASNTVASNLERMADHAVNIVSQIEHLKDPRFLHRYDYGTFFREILSALDLVYEAIINQDMNQAFRICRTEFDLDVLYKQQFERIMMELRSGKETENLITCLFILRYLERIGDAMLNVGEAIIFAAVGERFKIHQYEALTETLANTGLEVPISDVEFQSIWGTRSGCRIGKVTTKGGGKDERSKGGVLFKEGSARKLLEEKENIERWESIMPGLPPKVHATKVEGQQASLLIEFLGGCNFQEVALTAEPDIVENAQFLIEQTVTAIWDATRREEPVHVGYLGQLGSRIDDVYRLYPRFREPERSIAGKRLPPLEELLEQAAEVDQGLAAPYSVFIHGDFNMNNMIYDHENQQIHYIDLHRSRQTDPLQDISVFLVSNFRLPIFEPDLRQRLYWVMRRMYCFAKAYAHQHGDAAFDARLTLGLIRSFITSTRFELNHTFATAMFLRGRYLLERLLAHRGKPWEEFVLPGDVLVY